MDETNQSTDGVGQLRDAVTRAEATLAAQQAGLSPSQEQDIASRASDGADGFSSNADGLRAAAQAHRDAEAAKVTRPPPPPASDIVSGEPGGQQKITLDGDKPLSALNAAKALSDLHRAQQAEIDAYEAAFAEQGVSWEDVLNGNAPAGDQRNPSDAATSQTSELEQAKNQAAEAQAQAEQKRQQLEAERQHRLTYDLMSDQVRHQRYLISGAAMEVQRAFPDIRTEQDLKDAWVKNPQRAAEFTRVADALQGKALEAEALEKRAADVAKEVNKARAKAEDEKFLAAHPEYDSKEAPALQRQALASLKGAGFQEDELTRAWNGDAPLHMRDHRVQNFIASHTRLAQENAELKERLGIAEQGLRTSRIPKNVPPVSKPGVGSDESAGGYRDIATARRTVARATGDRASVLAGMDLLKAMRAARRV
jgi:hypothetical protein